MNYDKTKPVAEDNRPTEGFSTQDLALWTKDERLEYKNDTCPKGYLESVYFSDDELAGFERHHDFLKHQKALYVGLTTDQKSELVTHFNNNADYYLENSYSGKDNGIYSRSVKVRDKIVNRESYKAKLNKLNVVLGSVTVALAYFSL